MPYGIAETNLSFRHMEMENAPWLNSNASRVVYNDSSTSNYNTYQYNYLHGGNVWIGFVAGGTSGHVIDHNYFQNAGSNDPAIHTAGLTMASVSNVTISNNVFENISKNSAAAYIEPQFQSGTIDIYGNVFKATSSTSGSSQGIVAITSSDTVSKLDFYNNTIYSLNECLSACGVWAGNVSGSSVYVANNIWQSNPLLGGCNGTPAVIAANCKVTTPNIDGGNVSFVNAAAGNFHLAAPTIPLGTNLGSLYNIDPGGVIRTAWNLGAYEYTGTVVNPPTADQTAPVVTFTVPSTSSSLTVSFTTFSATDIVGVTGYLVTETATVPLATATGWTSTPTVGYIFTSAGSHTLYAWAKDAAGNVSASKSATVTITL